jgi:hypothetical protein
MFEQEEAARQPGSPGQGGMAMAKSPGVQPGPNYLALFVLGISIEAVGVIMLAVLWPIAIALMGSGIGLMAVGLAHRDEWRGAPTERPSSLESSDTEPGKDA